MKAFLQQLKLPVVVLLALLAAIAVTIGAIQLRAWWSEYASPSANSAVTAPSKEEKLRILAALSSTSSVSVVQKSKTLHGLSSSTDANPTEEEKLKILESLKAKP